MVTRKFQNRFQQFSEEIGAFIKRAAMDDAFLNKLVTWEHAERLMVAGCQAVHHPSKYKRNPAGARVQLRTWSSGQRVQIAFMTGQ